MNFDLIFHNKMSHAILERQEKLAGELISGKAQDWTDYRFRVGQLKGLSDALKFAEEINRELIGSEREKN